MRSTPFVSARFLKGNVMKRTSQFVVAMIAIIAIAGLAVGTTPAGAGRPAGAANSPFEPLRLAITDLMETFGDRYPNGEDYLKRLEALAKHGDMDQLEALGEEALLANPLLDFDKLLLIKRGAGSPELGLPQNWQGNSSLPREGFDDEIAVLSPVRPDGKLTTLHKPAGGRFVGDVDLHFDADRILFSSLDEERRWRIYEMNTDGTGLHKIPQIDEDDVDNYDACYLSDGAIIFSSSAPFAGVPCVRGSAHVANLFLLDPKTKNIRRLTFDQDHSWCPTMMNDGRVMYLRWEYSDLPHFVSRILFHMNPDGTEQMEYYGSNSYWPNSLFFARPIPHHPSKFVGIVGGHHGERRMGELVLFDVNKGRHEAQGVVQRIPGRGQKVEPILRDELITDSWPKFLHPYPLADSSTEAAAGKYFLSSAKPAPDSAWGVYLVDVFDNMTLIKELDGYALFEPLPLRETKKPPIIPSKVEPGRGDALVYISNIHAGPGLEGVPRGTVKQLRLFTYHFAYHDMGGQIDRVGLDGPWDIKRILGTVPVEPDGSAHFRIPANTPISLQPLDGEGKALQLMRSWMTAMPGELVQCAGCHEKQNTAPQNLQTTALGKPPSDITPWYGPTRGFSFKREVQPVLDKSCVSCHDGRTAEPDLRRAAPIHPPLPDEHYREGMKFTPSYMALRRYVRGPSMESDMHMLTPGEFHADTTRLVQILSKGHHGVQLGAEGWDRLITWIDLNTPAHGTWTEIVGEKKVGHQRDRRRALLKAYANIDEDPEAIVTTRYRAAAADFPPSRPEPGNSAEAAMPDWSFDVAEAKRRQTASGSPQRTVDLGGGVKLEMVVIPAGKFVMGDSGSPDERPRSAVTIDRPFWIGRFEVTNEQFARFDPSHDSRLEPGDFLHFSSEERGYPVNAASQPVARVSWNQAMTFCRWLSEKTGRKFTLPTEGQWEYAGRAGSRKPLWYGDTQTDFAPYANLADRNLSHVDNFRNWELPFNALLPWRPAIDDVNDRHRVAAPVGSYKPSPWGLFDVHGNVWEWTRSIYKPYPYRDGDGRNDLTGESKRVVRGGSWYDRPRLARLASRLAYQPWQRVYNVGFRVVSEP